MTAIGLVLAIVGVATIRLIEFGWAGLAPDDARYLYVGLSSLDGHGPLTPSGTVFLLRSPVYGLVLAAGSRLVGGGAVDGARLVAAALSVLALLAAVRYGWVLNGPLAAIGTTLAILAIPLFWTLLPTLRIDLSQSAGVVAVLLALHRPTVRRWALAGLVLGITILVKETVVLLVLAPIGLIGTLPTQRLARLWAVFVAGTVVVAAWWWAVVWVAAGAIFPLNAVGVIESRGVAADLHLDWFSVILAAVIGLAWLAVAIGARTDAARRLLIAAAICLLPPAVYATVNGLNVRNLAGLALLSAVAIGVAAADVAYWMRARGSARLPVAARATRPAVGAIVLAGLVILAGGGVAAAQRRVTAPSTAVLPDRVADWLRANTPPGGRAAMTFLDNEVVALELYGTIPVPDLATVRVDPGGPLSDDIWIGLRDRQLFGYARRDWTVALGQPGTSALVLAGPHPLTPDELIPALDRGEVPGVTPAGSLTEGADWASLYRVDSSALNLSSDVVPVHMSTAAAAAWIDQASGGRDAGVQALVDARAVVVGPATDLGNRLGGHACLAPTGTDEEARVVPAAECPPG